MCMYRFTQVPLHFSFLDLGTNQSKITEYEAVLFSQPTCMMSPEFRDVRSKRR